jgi:hypothetical protein
MDRSPPAHGPSPSTLTAPPAPERPAAAVRHLISLTRLPARRRTRRLRVAPFVSLSLSLSPPFPPLSLCPLVARRRWCREPCAGAGGGRGAAGGGAGRSAAWAASWRYKSGEQGRSSDGRFAGDEGPAGGNAFLFPSLPILLRSLGVFVFGSDRDFTNPICLQQLLGVHVYTHVLC